MSDERLIDYATGKNKLSSSSQELFEKFLNTNQTEKKLQAPLLLKSLYQLMKSLKKIKLKSILKAFQLNMILLLKLFALQKILLNLLEVIKGSLLTVDGDQKFLEAVERMKKAI